MFTFLLFQDIKPSVITQSLIVVETLLQDVGYDFQSINSIFSGVLNWGMFSHHTTRCTWRFSHENQAEILSATKSQPLYSRIVLLFESERCIHQNKNYIEKMTVYFSTRSIFSENNNSSTEKSGLSSTAKRAFNISCQFGSLQIEVT